MIRKNCLLLLLLLPFSLMAQQKVWTFRECLDTALQRNISVNQGKLTYESNKVSLAQVKANRIPSLSASVNEGLSLGKNVDPTTNTFVTQAYHSTNMGFNSSYNVFNGLQNTNNIRQNQLSVEASAYDIERLRNEVTLNVTTAYLQVLFAGEILQVAKNQEQATAAQVDRTEKMVRAGKSPETDLLQIKSQLATDNLSVINAQNQLDLARITLMQYMEIPITGDFDIAVPKNLEPAVFAQSNVDIYNKALQVMPQISGATLRSDAASMGLKVSEGARWPRLSLGGSLSTNFASSRQEATAVNPDGNPFFVQLWDNIGQNFNLGLSIPIYSNRQIKSNIERARINELNAKLTEQNTRNQLRKNVEQSYTDLRAAAKKYEATKIQLEAVEAVYRSAEQKFNVGVMNATDFLIQKNSYMQSQSNLIQTRYDYFFKSRIVDFYLGNGVKIE